MGVCTVGDSPEEGVGSYVSQVSGAVSTSTHACASRRSTSYDCLDSFHRSAKYPVTILAGNFTVSHIATIAAAKNSQCPLLSCKRKIAVGSSACNIALRCRGGAPEPFVEYEKSSECKYASNALAALCLISKEVSRSSS